MIKKMKECWSEMDRGEKLKTVLYGAAGIGFVFMVAGTYGAVKLSKELYEIMKPQ